MLRNGSRIKSPIIKLETTPEPTRSPVFKNLKSKGALKISFLCVFLPFVDT